MYDFDADSRTQKNHRAPYFDPARPSENAHGAVHAAGFDTTSGRLGAASNEWDSLMRWENSHESARVSGDGSRGKNGGPGTVHGPHADRPQNRMAADGPERAGTSSSRQGALATAPHTVTGMEGDRLDRNASSARHAQDEIFGAMFSETSSPRRDTHQHQDRSSDVARERGSGSGAAHNWSRAGGRNSSQQRTYEGDNSAPLTLAKAASISSGATIGIFKIKHKVSKGGFRQPVETKTNKIAIHAYGFKGWKSLIDHTADDDSTGIELNVFMALALDLDPTDHALKSVKAGTHGNPRGPSMPFDEIIRTNYKKIRKPSKKEAVALMLAMLNNKDGIHNMDLADKSNEGFVSVRAKVGALLSEFSARYMTDALSALSRKGDQLNRQSLGGFAQNVSDVGKNGTRKRSPVHTILAAALGTATGEALAYLKRNPKKANSFKARQSDDRRLLSINNAAYIIREFIDNMRNEEQVKVDQLMTAFNIAAAAISISGAGKFISSGLSAIKPVINRILTNSLTGNAKRTKQEIVGSYMEVINHFAIRHGIESTRFSSVKSQFTILDSAH